MTLRRATEGLTVAQACSGCMVGVASISSPSLFLACHAREGRVVGKQRRMRKGPGRADLQPCCPSFLAAMPPIIVIAAASGSLDPLKQIVSALPIPCAASVFIVLHVGPNQS